MINIIKDLKKNKIGNIVKDGKLSKYTTYRIGGPAPIIVYPKNTNKLIKLIQILRDKKINYKILGNGSNVIFSDELFNGVIIKLDELNSIDIDDGVITVGSGYNLIKFAYKLSKLGYTGIEFATGIPGTIGGAVYMNAGAYKSDMGYIVSSVKALTPDLKVIEIFNRDLHFHYRDSFFQHNKDYICLEAKIVLKRGNEEDIMNLIEDRKQKRLLSQPLEFPSAGSVFRNPIDGFAGHLIEEAGLKGYKIGGAQVSEKHANFIVNTGNAKATDVRELILFVQLKVREKFGIDLLIEQEFVNWE